MSAPAQTQEKPGKEAENDSAPERIAAFRRQLAENLALSKQLSVYWLQTRNKAKQLLDAVGERITKIVGPERDQAISQDQEKEYSKLAQMEREAKEIYTSAGEMIDRLKITSNGDGDEVEDEKQKPGGSVSGRSTGSPK